MKIEISLDRKEVDKFNKDIDTLFSEITKEVTKVSNYNTVIQKTQSGLKENAMGYENSPKYADLKQDLKRQGLIPYSTPGVVTGQLVEDLMIKVFSKSPNELVMGITFDDKVRQRPTLKSMWEVQRGISSSFEYQQRSSLELAKILTVSKFNYIDSIYDLYSKDYANVVLKAIDIAFKKV
jgi:hypothetical protein